MGETRDGERRETGRDERRWERRGETVEETGRDGVARECGEEREKIVWRRERSCNAHAIMRDVWH